MDRLSDVRVGDEFTWKSIYHNTYTFKCTAIAHDRMDVDYLDGQNAGQSTFFVLPDPSISIKITRRFDDPDPIEEPRLPPEYIYSVFRAYEADQIQRHINFHCEIGYELISLTPLGSSDIVVLMLKY